MNRYDAIRGAIGEADPWLTVPGNHRLLHCLAAGIEAGLSWQPEEPEVPAVREGTTWHLSGDTEYELLTEAQVIADHQRSAEEKLEVLLRWAYMRNKWIFANDVDGHVEFGKLTEQVNEILEPWKRERGLK